MAATQTPSEETVKKVYLTAEAIQAGLEAGELSFMEAAMMINDVPTVAEVQGDNGRPYVELTLNGVRPIRHTHETWRRIFSASPAFEKYLVREKKGASAE